MAYFPNGSAGEVFDEQCGRCKFGEGPCPIWHVQHEFNYSACNIPIARGILDALVKDDGTCAMYALDPKTFSNEAPQVDLLDYLAEQRRLFPPPSAP